MEENSNEYMVWVSSEPLESCVFCGEISMGIHMSSCPSNLISLHECQVQLFTRLQDDDRTEEEYHKFLLDSKWQERIKEFKAYPSSHFHDGHKYLEF